MKKQRKTNEEILKEIKSKYQFALKMRDYWKLEKTTYLLTNQESKANLVSDFIKEYETRMITLCDLYRFVSGLDILTTINELRKDAE